MNEKSLVSPKEFIIRRQVGLFRKLKEKFFTGELVIENLMGTRSEFYLYMGRLVYATGGVHPVRRYRRLLNLYCPEALRNFTSDLAENMTSRENEENAISWEYSLLNVWLNKGILSRNQVIELTQILLSEILFDLSLVGKVTYDLRFFSYTINRSIVIDAEQVITKTNKLCHAWQNTELKLFSPNLAPIIKKPQQLKQKISMQDYQNFERYFNGKLSLRELSTYLKQDLINIVKVLSNHVTEGLVELIEIPDLPSPNN